MSQPLMIGCCLILNWIGDQFNDYFGISNYNCALNTLLNKVLFFTFACFVISTELKMYYIPPVVLQFCNIFHIERSSGRKNI